MNGGYDANSELINGVLEGMKAAKTKTHVDLGICVPHVYLSHAEDLCYGTDLALAAQDCSAHEQGAFTGEVSAKMLTEFGVQYVLVGHSERREYQRESAQAVALKAQRALAAGITPVVCIGETLAQRDADQTMAVLTAQLQAVLDTLGAKEISRCVIAYEPIWAIGTGKTATPEQAQTIHLALRTWLATQGAGATHMKLLYGGSMKPDNAVSLIAQPDIDGGLIGGAALKAADFLAIASAVAANPV